MPTQFVLDLYVNNATNTGAFNEYKYTANPNPPGGFTHVRYSNPLGRVWWYSPDGGVIWQIVTAGTNSPAKAGDPNHAIPSLQFGDSFAVQLVDLNPNDANNKVATVQFAVVFAKRRDPADKTKHLANRASPFQTDPSSTGHVLTAFISGTLTPTSIQLTPPISSALYPVATASYPQATQNPAKAPGFSFYVAAIVTFGNGTGTAIQYAHDPEMDVPDYGG